MNNKCPENFELVSVIIPTWNRVDKLGEAIMSALNQTYGNLEVLVCDDGSTDNSEEFVKSIKDERVKWLPGSHSGLPSIPRNRGIRNAKGYWLAFLDSDDLWQPEKLELQLNSLHLNKTFAIATNAIRQDKQEGRGGLLLNLESVSKLSFADLIIDNKVITSSCLIKKDLIKRIGYFPESKKLKAYEDYAYWLRLSSFIYFDIINKPLVLYFDSPSTSIRSLAGNHLITKIYVMIDFFVWSFKKNRINLIPSFFIWFTTLIFNNFKKIYWKVMECLFSYKEKIYREVLQLNDGPKISVVMSVYNAELYLHQSIDSILNQSYSNFEFLIIDDCSTDATPLILQSYKDKRIKIIRNPRNKGIAESLNLGFSIAKSEFIARMDADDISHHDRLKIQLSYLIKNPDIGLVGSWISGFGELRTKFTHRYPVDDEEIKCSMLFENPIAHPTVMIRKNILPHSKYIYSKKYKFVEDWDLWFRLSSKVKFYNIPKVLLRYRIHSLSCSRKMGLEQNNSKNKFIKAMHSKLSIPYNEILFDEKLVWSKDVCIDFYNSLKLIQPYNTLRPLIFKNVTQARFNLFLLRHSASPFFSIKFLIFNRLDKMPYLYSINLIFRIFLYSSFRYIRALIN